MMSGFGQHVFTAGTSSQGTNAPPVSGGTYTSNLEDLSHAIRKPLPLRQQTDKATLRYTGVGTSGATSVPLMLTGHGRPAAVPLFSHSDIQYLRQQVQQYSTPPSMLNNVLFTSFVSKPLPTNSPNSLYTHTITNAPISNINVSVQQPPAQPVLPSSAAPRNPYARPISAQEIQPPDSLGSLGGLLMQSSSNSSMGSTGSPVLTPSTTGAYSGSSNVYSAAPNPGTQTNVFMKPQATLISNGSIYKSEKRSTHSTISVKKNKLGSVIYRPSSMTPPETETSVITNTNVDGDVGGSNTTISNLQPTIQQSPDDTAVAGGEQPSGKPNHMVVNAVIKSTSNSSSITVTVPRPPSATKRTAVRPASKAVSPVIPRSQSLVVCPEAYGFVTNIPDHPGPKVQGKPSSLDPKKTSKQGGSSPEAGQKELMTSPNKLMTNMIPKSSIPRPGTAARSRPGSACSRPEESPSQIRNLNYTPTKPYHEVNNNNLNHADSIKSATSQQQIAVVHTTRPSPPGRDEQTNKGLSVNHKPPVGPSNSKTMFYHKTSKTEIVLHKLAPQRPATEGAVAPAQIIDQPQQYTTPGNEEEWQDDEEDDEDSIQGERQPGDGEDNSDDNDDDDDDDDEDENDDDVGFEDDGIDDLDDDLADESDEDSCDVSRGGSAQSRVTTLRIRSATKRLLGLSLRDKDRNAAGRAARPTTGRTRPVSAVSTLSSNSDLLPALTASLFPNIPPTINFVNVGEKVEQLPWEIRKLFKWRMSPITPNVVKNCINRSGFRPSKRNHDWLGYWGKHMKAQGFKAVREYQKVNHFPGSFQIGRKDRLWRNLSRLQVQYGKKEFGFFPQTFVLPPDLKQLKRAFEDGGTKQKWIIKPPASARGIGIRVIHKWNQIPRKRAIIVQRYLSRPYLINDSKFDLRIYVYVTSYDPLRIYVYEDGLVRFASCKYSQAMKNLSNKYMHLTNYSINKKNNEYQSNSDDSVCQGHKWSLKALWGYMKKQGINTNTVWQSMLDLIVKTIISSESAVNSLVKANVRRRYSCNELFGFDIMLDDMLKPWIIEVNISPSLHSNSQLDISVKGGMIKDLMNLAGFRIPAKNDITPSAGSPPEAGSKFMVPPEICTDWRLHPTQMSSDEKAKHAYYCQRANDEQAQQTLLDILTPDDVRILTETIDEESRKGGFVRAFPHFHSHKYLRFFEQPRYYNLLLDCWVHRYHRMESRGILHLERLCSQSLHLENPTDDPRHQWAPPASLSSLDSRGATSASAMLKGSPNTNLPKLKKRVVKARPVHSVTGGSSTTSSTMSIASNDSVSTTSAPPGRGGTS